MNVGIFLCVIVLVGLVRAESDDDDVLYVRGSRVGLYGPPQVNWKTPREQIFRLEGPDGPSSIKTYDEAVAICQKAGVDIAPNWRLRDFVRRRGVRTCQPCGWMERVVTKRTYYKNYRPICSKKELESGEFHVPCAEDPADEGQQGYDVYCFGVSGPEIPEDSVAVNVGRHRGYVFVVKDISTDFIHSAAKARSLCQRRGADLALSKQVELAWYNGFSQCACGWTENYAAIPMRDSLSACHLFFRYGGCGFTNMTHAYCWADARGNPRGLRLVDFENLPKKTFPMGIEEGATKVSGGYVYPTYGLRGPGRTSRVSDAYYTCRNQGAKLATPEQLEEAMDNGMEWCKCGFVWENAVEIVSSRVEGTGGVYKMSKNGKCGGGNGLVRCPVKNPNKQGWDMFCFKECSSDCPTESAWKTPANSVRLNDGRVFHVESFQGKYKFASKTEAETACQGRNAHLATLDQLKEAQHYGLTKCRCGYLADGSVAFPMYRPIEGCGGDVGVFTCPGEYSDIPETGPNWDAYCFIS